jgi:hypothetical protein
MTTLYELSQQYAQLIDLAENDNDEGFQEALKNALDDIGGSIDDKVINCTTLILNLQAKEQSIKDAIDKLRGRKLSIERKVEGLKSYIFDNMKLCNKDKVSSDLFDVRIQKNPVRVEIVNEVEIPEAFVRIKTIVEPDKKAILEHGGCAGVRLVQGESLRIKV